MPSSTPKEARVMAAIAHGWRPSDPKLAKIPIGVAKEFNAADTGKPVRAPTVAHQRVAKKLMGKT